MRVAALATMPDSIRRVALTVSSLAGGALLSGRALLNGSWDWPMAVFGVAVAVAGLLGFGLLRRSLVARLAALLLAPIVVAQLDLGSRVERRVSLGGPSSRVRGRVSQGVGHADADLVDEQAESPAQQQVGG